MKGKIKMSTLKCKMCGGTLEINENETTATCEYCGTEQTIPKITDDVIGNLFNRANTLRLKSEFDKAEEIYNKIVGLDNTQSEAYWGIILCKYGIEYVEDPTTYKRVPTCHRTSYDAITADEDYKLAIQYADISQKIIYEAEAKAIDEIQKGILTISQNEKPYDVFICYKETDESGKRTQDSVLANDIYHQLTQEGFKVFYAAITLEDKLGQEYEPYIFAALNSAKVMLVIGSKPEYFTAVWVKNEWSRYLKLMKADRSKLLIPCYKDMDAYELPEEFAHLQAQDMGKIGFINDIVRGIKKVINKDEPKSAVKETTAAGQAANSGVAPLLKRISLFLEDGNWQEADEYCERVLDSDPENAQAYLYKLMAKMEVRKTEDLRNQAQPFDSEDMYRKTVRFADEELKNTLEEYNAYIKDRNEKKRIESIYNKAVYDMGYARDEISYKIIIEDLAEIPGYKDADEKKKECEEKAEECRLESLYNSAAELQTVHSEDNQFRAAKQFEELGTYKDSAERVQQCKDKADEIRKEEERIKAEREKAEKEREAKAKKKKIVLIIISSVMAVCAVLALIYGIVIVPSIKYNEALELVENKNYDEAIAIFEELGDYSDSADMICEAKYKKAEELMSNKKFDVALEIFNELGNYSDSKDKISDILKEKLKVAEIGSVIKFGKYEQDNDTSNGEEEIEWLVLAKDDDKMLVITDKAIDCIEYDTIPSSDLTWENSRIRSWLKSFHFKAFSSEERAIIQTTNVSADENPTFNTNPGNSTQDNVFLLSFAEAEKYFVDENARACKATNYAATFKNETNTGYGKCIWWLRTPGNSSMYATVVAYDGSLSKYGILVFEKIYVRPAMWISLA